MFETKVLFCAPAGCKDPQNDALGHLFMYYSLYKSSGKIMHTPGAQVHKSMHLAAKMCTHVTQGAPLNPPIKFLFFAISINKYQAYALTFLKRWMDRNYMNIRKIYDHILPFPWLTESHRKYICGAPTFCWHWHFVLPHWMVVCKFFWKTHWSRQSLCTLPAVKEGSTELLCHKLHGPTSPRAEFSW